MKKFTFLFFTLGSALAIAQPTSFVAHGIGGGGAQYSPSINPANPSEIYSSTDMTDLYHSINGGASWNVINFRQVIGGAFAMVQFTNNNSIRYCQSMDPVSQVLIPIKSTDAGLTWNPTTDPTGGNGSWFTIANPQNSNQLIVSDYSDLYFSNDGGTTFGAAFYVDGTGNGAYVAGTFFDGLNIYVCTQAGLLVSTNGGGSWTGPTLNGISNEDIIGFGGGKVGTTTHFYCVTQSLGSAYPGTNGENASNYANTYSMTYPGTWAIAETGILAGDYPMFVSMASNSINDCYLGGESGTGDPIVLKTSNGGASWSYVFKTAGNQNIKTGYCGQNGDLGWSWPQYVFGLNVSLADSNDIVETDEGFIHASTDGGNTWSALYVPPANLNPLNANTPKGHYYPTNGIEMTSTWNMMWYDSVHVFGGFTDVTGVRSNDGGNTWGFDCSGLYGYNTTYMFLKNPTNGVVYAATSSIHDMYQSTRLTDNNIDGGTGAVMFSTDTGKTFTTMYNFGHPVIWLALDPTNPNRMYASVINHKGAGNAGGIWVSNNINLNASATWTHCNNPARTQGHPLDIRVLKDGTVVATFSGRRNAVNFTDSSGVFVSVNQGNTWTDVSAPGMKYWTMDLTVDPNDTAQNTWYCCVYSGWGGPANGQGGLYRTTNRGTNWTKIINSVNSNNGDTTSCFSITFDPVNKGAAYLTTETGGLFYTANAEAPSPIFTAVNAYPFQEPLRVFFNPYNQNDVWVSSFGNGLEMGSLVPNAVNNMSTKSQEAILYPNPNNGKFIISLGHVPMAIGIVSASHPMIEIYNILGEKVFNATLKQVQGDNNLDLTNQPSGVYLYLVLTEKGELISEGKLIIQK
jgi:photosystem II stability/assembly factor-like uncharacterized protein